MVTMVSPQTFTQVLQSLTPFSNYTCCVEAIYTDQGENAEVCRTTSTLEGGIQLNLHYKPLNSIFFLFVCFSVPGPPTNLQAQPSSTTCGEVTLTWDLPPEDERNGIFIATRINLCHL